MSQDVPSEPKRVKSILKIDVNRELTLIRVKMSQKKTGNFSSFQKPGKSQLKREEAIDRNAKVTQMLKLSDSNDFRENIIKIQQQARMDTLEKMKSFRKEIQDEINVGVRSYSGIEKYIDTLFK